MLLLFLCEGCVSVLNSDGFGNIDHAQTIYGIRNEMGNDGRISVVYCSRDSNSIADQLAKKGSRLRRNSLSWSDF